MNIQQMQTEVARIVTTASNIRQAIEQAQADTTIAALCREIITDAVVLAWGERRANEIDQFLSIE